MDSSSTGSILAAGGLLWRTVEGQRLLAVVHRPRHNDWTLPKGKLQDGENFAAASQREVFEETGCEPCLQGFAGTRSYPSREGHKVVSFWHMHCDGTCTFTPSDEVDQLEWLPFSSAVSRLSYPDEAAFLQSVDLTAPDPPKTLPASSEFPPRPGLFSRLLTRLPWRSTSHKRLTHSVVAFRQEFSALAVRPIQPGAPPGWQAAVYILLDKVEWALKNNDAELGWRCFNAADRMVQYGLTQPERQIHAQVLALQAVQKLRGWRKNSIERLLLDPDGNLKACVDVNSLMQATLILHEHNENTYLKLYSFRSQLILLSLIGLIIAGYFFVVPLPLANLAANDPLLLRYIILFGILGASISGTLSLANRGTGEYITAQMASFWIAFARVAVGAVAALVVYAFLSAGLINLEPGGLTPWAILAFSFAAGFSERLLTRTVGTISG